MCCGVSVLAMSLAAVLAGQPKSAVLFATAMTATGSDYVAAGEGGLPPRARMTRCWSSAKVLRCDWPARLALTPYAPTDTVERGCVCGLEPFDWGRGSGWTVLRQAATFRTAVGVTTYERPA